MQKQQKVSTDIVKQIGDYTINTKDILGQGSFGIVYKCTDTSKTTWAAKQISKSLISEKKEYLESLLRQEVTLQKKMKSQNIVKLKDFLITDNNYYLILDFCDGGDLKQQLAKEKLFTEQKAKEIMIQIIKGLKEMNERKIVHRDIKPENILVATSPNGNIYKIGDFGFAKSMNDDDIIKSQVGTPLYMDPQILMGKPYDNKCDIWSLGIIFYEMLFGSTPWPKVKSQYDLLEKIRFVPLKFHDSISVSDKAKSLIKRMVERDPSKRISYSELLSDNYFKKINYIKIFQHLKDQQAQSVKSNKTLNIQPKVIELPPQLNLTVQNKENSSMTDNDNYNQNVAQVYQLLEFSKKDFEMFNKKMFNLNSGCLDLTLFQQFVELFLGKGDYSKFFDFVLQQSQEFNIKKSPQNQKKVLLEDLILLFKSYDQDFEKYIHEYLQTQNISTNLPQHQRRESTPLPIQPYQTNTSFGINNINDQTGIYKNQTITTRDYKELVIKQVEQITTNKTNIEQTFSPYINQEKLTELLPPIKQNYSDNKLELNVTDQFKYLDNQITNQNINLHLQSMQNIQCNLQNKLITQESPKSEKEKGKMNDIDEIIQNIQQKNDSLTQQPNIQLTKIQSDNILLSNQKLELNQGFSENAIKYFGSDTQKSLDEKISEDIQQKNTTININCNEIQENPFLQINKNNEVNLLSKIPEQTNEINNINNIQQNQFIDLFEDITDTFKEFKNKQIQPQRRNSEQIQSLQFSFQKDQQISSNSTKNMQSSLSNNQQFNKAVEFHSKSSNNILQNSQTSEQNKENLKNILNNDYIDQILYPLSQYCKQFTNPEKQLPSQVSNSNEILQKEINEKLQELNINSNNQLENHKSESCQMYSPNKTQKIKHQKSYNPFDTSPSGSFVSDEGEREYGDNFFLDFSPNKSFEKPQQNEKFVQLNQKENECQNKMKPFVSNELHFSQKPDNKVNDQQHHISTGISYIFYD